MWAVPRAPRHALGASELGAVTGGAETVVGGQQPRPPHPRSPFAAGVGDGAAEPTNLKTTRPARPPLTGTPASCGFCRRPGAKVVPHGGLEEVPAPLSLPQGGPRGLKATMLVR